ncbi:hypothetical protein QR680_003704 [Steinernema hermaphroditum]|uniref:Uncharacterized protein n=1 Tax=Steinernema hermaphroditum TaxID=289476 RepID=A0AA39LSF2_9BILA|nr:hypothetical protein QR680_003704 [Steinernema hermaphroditum]
MVPFNPNHSGLLKRRRGPKRAPEAQQGSWRWIVYDGTTKVPMQTNCPVVRGQLVDIELQLQGSMICLNFDPFVTNC